MTIERYAGVPLDINLALALHGRPAPGGGYRGLTDELDALVMEAAEALRAAYDCDIQVRYNSNRRSGGAYLMPEHRYSVTGIGAGLRKVRPEGMSAEAFYDLPRAEWDALIDEVYIKSNVRAGMLRDPDLATHGRSIGEGYSYEEHESVAAAIAWLTDNVKVPA